MFDRSLLVSMCVSVSVSVCLGNRGNGETMHITPFTVLSVTYFEVSYMVGPHYYCYCCRSIGSVPINALCYLSLSLSQSPTLYVLRTHSTVHTIKRFETESFHIRMYGGKQTSERTNESISIWVCVFQCA